MEKHGFDFVRFSDLHRKLRRSIDLPIKTNITPVVKPIVKPVIKWAGGKTKILHAFINYIFSANSLCYVEPFLGGASVAMTLMSKGLKTKYILNDKNAHLINMYKCIKTDISLLIDCLKTYEDKLSEEAYSKVRDEFNNIVEVELDYENAARFIYLIKTCFRGLYRVNKNNKFNVPYGHYKTLKFDYDNLRSVSALLNSYDVTFLNMSYQELDIPTNSFIYLDPPYLNAFSSYTDDRFSYKDFDNYVNNKLNGMKWIISNSIGYESHITNLEFMYKNISAQDRINSKKPNSSRAEVIVYSIL